MRLHSYVVEYDDGFAPNPFFGYCTLATCKPAIRRGASVGDVVLGVGSASNKRSGHVVYFMEVEEVMTYASYWADARFRRKRPRMQATTKYMVGDNIYHEEDGRWVQEDSLHSNPDGSTNLDHLNKDTDVDRVLVSSDFCYWGGSGLEIPEHLRSSHYKNPWYMGRAHRNHFEEELRSEIVDWLRRQPSRGYKGKPSGWSRPQS